MHGAATPRHDPCLPAASPDDTPRPGWPAPLVKMPSERLVRAVLANVDAWVSALDEIYDAAEPNNRAGVLALKLQMLLSKVSFLRVVDGTQEEIDAAYAQARWNADRPARDEQ